MVKFLHGIGLNSEVMYFAGLASVLASIGAWARSSQTEDKASAERWGIFVGLWAPTFMEIGNALKSAEKK